MEEEYTKRTRVNRKRNARKEHAKNKRLQKEQERTSRPSSCRLGKNQKKLIARTNIILDEQNQTTDEEPTSQSHRIILRRQHRKQSHRPAEKTRISETSHLHDLEDDDDGYDWGRMMAENSYKAHRERREREQNERDIQLIYERILQETKRNFARAARSNYPVGPFRHEQPYTILRETRCCTGNCIIYEKQESKHNLARAARSNYPVGPFRHEEPYTIWKETRCSTGNCIIYEK